jgi:hypothetical protein
MSNIRPIRAIKDLSNTKDKIGRVDVLLHGIGSLLTRKLEEHTNLPGLANGLMPILDDEIRKNVPAKAVIPKKYRELAKLVAQRF